MPICNPSDLPALLPRRARLMGFDVGARTIGIAISDPALGFAAPLETIRRTRWEADAARILALVATWQAGGFVVGLALNMDDSEGPSAQRCRAFARNLLAVADLPMIFCDDRLSTAAAEDALREAGTRPGQARHGIDAVAAAIILQDALTLIARSGVIPKA
jgi:putative Holliday junction resolvase